MSDSLVASGNVLHTLKIVRVMRQELGGKTRFSPLVIERHAGEFADMQELMRYARMGASVRVAALAFNDKQSWEGLVTANVLMAAYIVCQNIGHLTADVLAEVIAGEVVELVGHERWGLDDCDEATQIEGKNLYTTQLDKQGMSVWVVSWVQRMRINTPISESELDDFLRLYLEQHLGDGAPINAADINVRETQRETS